MDLNEISRHRNYKDELVRLMQRKGANLKYHTIPHDTHNDRVYISRVQVDIEGEARGRGLH